MFGSQPSRAGYWKFTWEAGHGDWEWIDEEVRFDPARQLFVEKQTTRPYPGFAQFHCDLDTTSFMNFLERIQKMGLDGADIQWLQRLIGETSPNSVVKEGMVSTFNGTQAVFDLNFQVSYSGAVAIDLKAESDFAAALRAELATWCRAN